MHRVVAASAAAGNVQEKTQEWLSMDTDAASRAAVEQLLQKQAHTELEDLMCKRLEFGRFQVWLLCDSVLARKVVGPTQYCFPSTAMPSHMDGLHEWQPQNVDVTILKVDQSTGHYNSRHQLSLRPYRLYACTQLHTCNCTSHHTTRLPAKLLQKTFQI
jgi:hypothetical protein